MSVTTFASLRQDAVVLGPVVLLAEDDDRGLARARAVVRRHRVPTLEPEDARRAASYVAARETPLMIVVPSTPSWGLTAVAALRRGSPAPLVVAGLTPSSDELIELLDAGATIVVDGGASERELASRISALYDVAQTETCGAARWLEAGGLHVDLSARTCSLDGEPIQLSRNEYKLLVFLMGRAQQTIAPEEIVRQVWRWSHGDGLNTLRIHIGRLRSKLGDDPRAPRYVASLRGAGYQFVEAVAELADEPAGVASRRGDAILGARLDGLYSVVDAVCAAADVPDLGARATAAVVASSHCDAATLFRYEQGHRSILVGSTGTSNSWNDAMRNGHALSPRFIGGEAAQRGCVVQVADIRRAGKRFPASATLMSADRLRSCLVVPLVVDGELWGDIGFVKRQPRAFTPDQTTYLRSITDLVALRLASV